MKKRKEKKNPHEIIFGSNIPYLEKARRKGKYTIELTDGEAEGFILDMRQFEAKIEELSDVFWKKARPIYNKSHDFFFNYYFKQLKKKTF